MKTKSLSFLLMLPLLYLASCSKNALNETPEETSQVVSKDEITTSGVTTLNVDDPSLVFVEYVGGQYISSYEGGITFGPTLPHPIDDPTGIYDGYPISTITYVNWTLNPSAPVPYAINEAYFSMLQPTFPSSGITGEAATIQAIQDYQTALNSISQNATLTHEEKVQQANALASPQITAVATGGGGVKRVSGLLVRDHLSPTQMSVVNERYVRPTITSPGKLVGVAFKSGYRIEMYAPTASTSGPVTSVKVTYSNVVQTVASFNVSYSGTFESYHTIGSVTLSSGQVFAIDNYLEP
jgi:hypothetical protein